MVNTSVYESMNLAELCLFMKAQREAKEEILSEAPKRQNKPTKEDL